MNYDATQPSLHVVADSISMHYGPYLESYVASVFKYSRKQKQMPDFENEEGANGQDSSCVLEYLRKCFRFKYRWDFLLINCGLHDIRCRAVDGLQVKPDVYRKNLKEIFSIATTSLGKNVLWVSTTPVLDNHHNTLKTEYTRCNADVVRYNEISYSEALESGASVIDLYSCTNANFGPDSLLDHIHFNNTSRRVQAAFLAGALFSILNRSSHEQ